MKKRLFLLAVLLASASMASAQKTKIAVSELGYLENKKVERTELKKQITPLVNENAIVRSSKEGVATSPLQKTPTALKANYYRPAGTLLGGMDTGGRGYVPLIVGHGNVEWKFKNKSTDYTSLEWYIPTT
jgi:hypothetical protein